MVYPAGLRVHHYAFYILFAYACHCSSEGQHSQKAYDILAACYSFVEQNDVLENSEKIMLFAHLVRTSASSGKSSNVIRYGCKLLMLAASLEMKKYTLSEMKKALQELGQYKEIERISDIRACLDHLSKFGNKDCENYTQAYIFSQLSEFSFDQGDYNDVLETAQRMLEVSKSLNHPFNLKLEAGACKAFGRVYCTIGECEKAQENLERTLYIVKNLLHDDSETGRTYADLGNVLRDRRKFDEAIESFKKGLDISLKLGDTVAAERAYSNLGICYRRTSNFQEAIKCINKSLELQKNLGDPKGEGQTLGNLANTFISVGEFEKALHYNKTSLKIAEEFRDVDGQLLAYFRSGVMYYTLRKYEDQCRSMCQCISISDRLRTNFLKNDQFNMSMAKYYFRAHQLLMMGLLHLSYQKKALLVLDVGRSKALFDLQRLSSAVSECLLDVQNTQWIEEILEVVDQRKPDSHAFVSENVCCSLTGGAAVVFGFDLDDSLLTWVVTEKETFQRKWSPSHQTARMFFQRLSRLLQKTLAKLRPSRLGLKDQRDESRKTRVEKLNELPYELETIIVGTGKPSAKNSTSKRTPNNEQKTKGLDDEFENIFREGEKVSESVARGDLRQVNISIMRIFSSVYKSLIAPVEDLLTGLKLIIVPADSLFLLPFPALPDRDGKHLCDRFSIQITPALHTLNFILLNPLKPLGPSLCVGNPSVGKVFFQDNVVSIDSLRGAEDEATECAAYFEAEPLLNKQATKKNVLSRMKNASVFHMAAHGNMDYGEIFLAPNPEAPFPPKKEHYLLVPEDILKCSLSARLVVLSCCHSGHGEVSSEGVAGTARAFLGAGARAVLVALWALPDKETRAFMKLFYENVCKGLSVCVSLQQAMKSFKESNYGVIAWAPFEIFGEDVVISSEELCEIRRLNRKHQGWCSD